MIIVSLHTDRQLDRSVMRLDLRKASWYRGATACSYRTFEDLGEAYRFARESLGKPSPDEAWGTGEMPVIGANIARADVACDRLIENIGTVLSAKWMPDEHSYHAPA